MCFPIEVDGKLKELSVFPNKVNSYLIVGLVKDGKQILVYHHRLMAKAFIPNPENKPYVNHIDGNKQNNSLSNLEWVTASENVQHAYDVLKIKEYPRYKQYSIERHNRKIEKEKKYKADKFIRHAIRCVETGEIFQSSTVASKAFNVTRQMIYHCLTTHNAVHNKYHFVRIRDL